MCMRVLRSIGQVAADWFWNPPESIINGPRVRWLLTRFKMRSLNSGERHSAIVIALTRILARGNSLQRRRSRRGREPSQTQGVLMVHPSILRNPLRIALAAVGPALLKVSRAFPSTDLASPG